MDKSTHIKLIAFLLVTAMVTVFCATGGGNAPQEEAPPLTAQLTEISGKVQVLKKMEGAFKNAEPNTQIQEQDQVLTGDDGRVRMDLSNGTIVRLSPLSNFVLKGIQNSPEGPLTKLELTIGRLWIILKGGVVEVDTPSGLASVRGSYLHVWVDPQTQVTHVTCLEGKCTLGNDAGTVALVAGQTATLKGAFEPPVADKMTDEDVQDWLDMNPEATLVVVPLTQTVAANQDKPLPEAKTNTPTPTGLPTSTPTITPTPTTSGTPADCGPPLGWVLHTVREGETLDSLSALYRVDKAEIQKANCRGELTFITAGEKMYVPNVATSTPTKTPTPTPTATETPLASATFNWTQTISAGGATWTPTNAVTTFEGPVGPDNETISDASMCGNSYKITAKDANGIAEVKMIYTFDGTLPKRDTAMAAGNYVLLPLLDAKLSRYGVSGYVIDTSGKAPPVNIRFRFVAMDKLGNIAYYEKADAYDLTDKVNCNDSLVNTPTKFNSAFGPSDITDANFCSQTFQVNITEPDGVTEVKLLYNVDGVTPTYSTAVAAGDYFMMADQGGGTYKVTAVIDSSGGTSDTVKYVFSVKDSKGDIRESNLYTYNDTVNCGVTTYTVLATPVSVLTSPELCSQTYTVNVKDANGISLVEVYFTISHTINGTTSTGNFALPKTSGTSFDGTYSSAMAIDTSAFTTPTITVKYDVKSKDTSDNETTLYSSSFTDDQTCTP